MKKYTYLIYQEDHDETAEDADEFQSIWEANDLTYIAEEYAEYYHDNRDGWESKWPLKFTIANEGGEVLGVVSVDREARPHFYGALIKKDKKTY